VNSSRSAYRQVFDEQRILESAPRNLEHQATLPGVNLPSFFADFGTVSTAKYWGGEARFDSTGGNLFVDPVAPTVSDALSIRPLPVEHPDMDAALALRLFRSVCESLGTDALWLRTPDMQGPLNTAGLVVEQEELLIAMHTEPERVSEFLGVVTEFLVGYARHFREATGDRVCGFIWPYTFFPASCGLSLTEDLMPLLSPDTYRRFAVPYLRRLSDEFGGLQIHCCGHWGRHAATLKESGARIRAVEFHHPFTRIEELTCLAAETVFIPYVSLDKQDEFRSSVDFYEHLLRSTDSSHRYWFAFPDDGADAIAFASRHGF
jgi:hypothetical protein